MRGRTVAQICPRCGGDEIGPAGKPPLEKALDIFNPMCHLRCSTCERTYWTVKPLIEAIATTIVALAFALFIVNAVVQMVMHAVGAQYDLADHSVLFQNVDPQLKCPECGSDHLSHSIRQPLERIVALVNPMAPYRCWKCWTRFWRFGGALHVASTLVAACFFVLVIFTSVISFTTRRKEIQKWLNRSAG